MKTFDVPDTIPISKVRAFLADLGIPTTDLRALVIDPGEVCIEVYANDENGKRYIVGAGDDRNVAMHRIAIRLDREA